MTFFMLNSFRGEEKTGGKDAKKNQVPYENRHCYIEMNGTLLMIAE